MMVRNSKFTNEFSELHRRNYENNIIFLFPLVKLSVKLHYKSQRPPLQFIFSPVSFHSFVFSFHFLQDFCVFVL